MSDVNDHEGDASQTSNVIHGEGRIVALDLGTEHTGVAVSDERQLVVRRVAVLPRANWKTLLRKIEQLCRDFDARALVVGLPLNLDGTNGVAAENARRIARNLQLSLRMPVYLQDERLSSRAAIEELKSEGCSAKDFREAVHSQSAAIILRDFLTMPESARISVLSSSSKLNTYS